MRSEYLELRKTFDNFYDPELVEGKIKIEKVYSACKAGHLCGKIRLKS